MTYSLRLNPQAERFFARADRPLAMKLARCFDQLEREPRNHPNIKPLKGAYSGAYRYRVGDHRVVYQIDEGKKSVLVIVIAHRRDVYG